MAMCDALEEAILSSFTEFLCWMYCLNNDIFCGYSLHSCCSVVWNCFALFSLIRINLGRCMWRHRSLSLPWCTYHLTAQAVAWSSVCVAKGQSFPPDPRNVTGYSASSWVARSSFAVSGCTTKWWVDKKVPTWCNNCDILSKFISTCFGHLHAHLQEYILYATAYSVQH